MLVAYVGAWCLCFVCVQTMAEAFDVDNNLRMGVIFSNYKSKDACNRNGKSLGC